MIGEVEGVELKEKDPWEIFKADMLEMYYDYMYIKDRKVPSIIKDTKYKKINNIYKEIEKKCRDYVEENPLKLKDLEELFVYILEIDSISFKKSTSENLLEFICDVLKLDKKLKANFSEKIYKEYV